MKFGKKTIRKIRSFFKKSGMLTWIIFLLLWKFVSLFYSKVFLPSPWETLQGAAEILSDGTLFDFMLISELRVLKGWMLSMLIGIPMGLLIGRIPSAKYIFEPFVDIFRFVPAISLLTLFLMWFGVGEESKIALIVYASCFTVIVNTVAGVAGTERTRIQAARALGANEWQILTTVIIPSAVPDIFTGIRLGLGNAFTAIVGAEMMAANEGLGYLIYSARLYFHTDWILIGIVILGLMGYVSDKILKFIGKKLLNRFGINDENHFEQAVQS